MRSILYLKSKKNIHSSIKCVYIKYKKGLLDIRRNGTILGVSIQTHRASGSGAGAKNERHEEL